eukprot:TRINITY_DN50378_c0_g1_i1.p1 TRINITY_DN50378_c0_g1~~TRINITY_DN50378_c0_g1_i1.p1  ORF type:complete len:383 (+),score=56.69 TRINITY_DN50378_c0_g1_i1:70-1149(+)
MSDNFESTSDDKAFELERFLSEHKVRARAISLKRCASRWASCESHMRSVLPPALDFEMAEGIDGSLYKGLLPAHPEDDDDGEVSQVEVEEHHIQALEEAMGCRLYRGWPVCETEDVLRAFAAAKKDADRSDDDNSLQDLSEAEVWNRYYGWFSDWPRNRARPYIEFHCRHITLGEVGSALSHAKLIDEAYRDGVDLAIFFEDDARPFPGSLERLLSEVHSLEKSKFEWDLIYLRASLYSLTPEEELAPEVPGSSLYWAQHRKVTDAYCLSRRGLGRISTSGYRQSLFAFDDFLPSLHSPHPRRDVMRLPCVMAARGEACSTERSQFVGLCFGPEVLSEVVVSGSETNFSPCVLGDHGAT